jgi:hypothetical protein
MKMSEHNRVPKGNVRENGLWFLPKLAQGLNTNQSINQSLDSSKRSCSFKMHHQNINFMQKITPHAIPSIYVFKVAATAGLHA